LHQELPDELPLSGAFPVPSGVFSPTFGVYLTEHLAAPVAGLFGGLVGGLVLVASGLLPHAQLARDFWPRKAIKVM
jgi:hypothetical protein